MNEIPTIYYVIGSSFLFIALLVCLLISFGRHTDIDEDEMTKTFKK